MARFCSMCGSPLDPATGLCPRCNAQAASAQMPNPAEDIDATVRVSPVPAPGAAAYQQPTPPAEDIDATVRVSPVPAPGAAAYQQPTPPAEDIDATMRVNPAPAENYGAAPQRPVNAPPFTPYTQVRPAAPAQNHEAYQVPAEVSAKPKKKKSAGSVVATIFLAFSMFVFLLVAAVLISVRTFTSEDVIKSTMEKVEFTDIMDAANGFISTDQENEDFTDVFYNNLNIRIKEKTGENIERRKLEKAINKTTIMEFLAEKMAHYASDVFNNDREFELDQNEVEQLLDENYAVIKEEFGIRNLDSAQKRETIESIADTLVADDVIEDITPSAIKKSNPAIYNAVNIGFSWPVIIVLLILVALLAFLMIKNDLSQAAVGSGVVCCIIGGIFTVAGLLALMSPGILEAVFGNVFFGILACGFLTANLPMFAVILVIGIGALVARGIVLKVNSKR